MDEWKRIIGQAYQGWVGNALAIFSILGLFTLIGREYRTVLEIWKNPPVSAYGVIYLLLLFVPLLLAVLTFQAPMGEAKPVRIVSAVLGIINLYLISLSFFMSWSSALFYHPILNMNMDLNALGGMGYQMQAARSALALPILLIFVIYAVLIFSIVHIANFWDQFFSWKVSGIFNLAMSPNSKDDATDVVLCIDEKTKKPMMWYEVDQPMNLGIIGPVGSGKTTMMIIPVLAQFLTNSRVGVFCVEPKGDLVGQLAELDEKAGRDYVFINPGQPDCPIFNPLWGDDYEIVAEVNKNALAAQFGQQDPFFSKNQAVAAKNMILLLKYMKGDNCSYVDLTRCLESDNETHEMVNQFERSLPAGLPNDDSRAMLLHWFKNEYFGENAKEIKRFTLGLRIQIDEMLGNAYFRKITCGRSTFSMLDAIESGRDIFVSTNDGILGDQLSSMLGILLVQHYQAAIQKRGVLPPAGEERRKFKLSVCALDEFGGYVNSEFSKFLSKARGYGVQMVLAMQSTSQLLRVGGQNNTGFRDDILTNLRSMVIFGGINVSDAKYFSDTFGKQEEEVVSTNSSVTRGKMSWFVPDSSNEGTRSQIMDKEIYNPTEIMYLPVHRIYYRVMQNRSLQKPGIGMVDWFTRDKSNIGGAYWFDMSEFNKRIEEKQQKLNPPQGFLGMLGIDWGRSKEKSRVSPENDEAIISDDEESLAYVPSQKHRKSALQEFDVKATMNAMAAAGLRDEQTPTNDHETANETLLSFALEGEEEYDVPVVKSAEKIEPQVDDTEAWDNFSPSIAFNSPVSQEQNEVQVDEQGLEVIPNDADDILNKF